MSDLLLKPAPQTTVYPRKYARASATRSGLRAARPNLEWPPLRLLPDSDNVRHKFRGGLAGGALRRVRAYIDTHIGERISLDELARQAGAAGFTSPDNFGSAPGKVRWGTCVGYV
jgi:hypothetical protein